MSRKEPRTEGYYTVCKKGAFRNERAEIFLLIPFGAVHRFVMLPLFLAFTVLSRKILQHFLEFLLTSAGFKQSVQTGETQTPQLFFNSSG